MPLDFQTQLNAFDTTPSTESGTTSDTDSSRDTSRDTGSKDTSTPHSSDPLDTFYTAVQDTFHETYPTSLTRLDGITVPSPYRDIFVTSDFPADVDAVPVYLGQWTLDYHDNTTVTYRASGRVYDEQWGDGGSIVRHNLYFNDSGANRDDTWHHRVELVAGYENPQQIQNAVTSDTDSLTGIQGYSPQDNEGDYGYSSGTQTRFEDAHTALTTLVAQLHTEPTAIRPRLPECDESAWRLTSHGLQTAKYKRQAPPESPYDYLRLIAMADHVSLEGAQTDDAAANHDHTPVPIPDFLPDNCVTQTETATQVVATGLTPHLITHTLEQPVDALLESTALVEPSRS